MPKTILMAGQSCTHAGWYITETTRRCHCEMRLVLQVGEKTPLCPRCEKAVNWVLIVTPTPWKQEVEAKAPPRNRPAK